MNDPLDFSVAGMPVPQGSMIARLIRGRPKVVADNAHDLARWRKRVSAVAAARMEFRRPWAPQTPVSVQLVFGFARPATVRRPRPSVRPDADKLARACLDALTDAGVWADDGQVVDLRAHKFYSPTPGVRVLVRDADLGERPLPQRQGERTNP